MTAETALAAALTGFRRSPSLLRLTPAVQHYDWGGTQFIARLVGSANPEHLPFAELWVGTHPKGPALAQVGGISVPLTRIVASSPSEVLGAETAARFGGELPYLLKVLDAAGMLSIQAHPSRRQADEGFARENAAGVPLDSPVRNYQDRNAKPEIHVALSEFWMLHGFRTPEEIEEVMVTAPEIGAAMPDFPRRLAGAGWDPQARQGLLRDLYQLVMIMPQDRVDRLLDALVSRLEHEAGLDRDNPNYWTLSAARAHRRPDGHRDRGIFSIYLMNLVHLRPGQGTFQPPGTLHAYLQGVNVELMASSDNVLRGGLTAKHVDAPELLRTLSFEFGRPPILEGRQVSETERVYEAPVEDFLLSRLEIAEGRTHRAGAGHGPDCLLVCGGSARVTWPSGSMDLPLGAAVLAPAGIPYVLEPRLPDRSVVMFRAGVPPNGKGLPG